MVKETTTLNSTHIYR